MRLASLGWVAIGLVVLSGSAGAVPVDGSLDPQYGAPVSTQTTGTSLGDLPADWLNGSELDGAFGFIAGDTLHLLLAGGYNRFYSEPLAFPNQLQLYIDVGPGGQNALSGDNPSVGYSLKLQSMAGLRFDADFAPDYWLGGARESSGANPFHAYYAELPAGGGGAGYFLGSSSIGGAGTLSGVDANNPYGILASIDISNTAGVGGGCGEASGAGVSTGIEWAIPLSAIGHPSGPVRVCALLASVASGGGQVSNQVLGPVPPGTCALGPASGVDFADVPGPQYFTVDAVTPVKRMTWGRLKILYR